MSGSNAELNAVAEAAVAWKLERYASDPLLWMAEQVRTFDEQDQVAAKPFPAHKTYVQFLVNELRSHRFVAIEKSRQMFVTWLIAAFAVHDCMFAPSSRWGVVSTKEETSDAVLDRAWYIYSKQDPWLRTERRATRKSCWITYHHADGDSWMQAVSTTAASGRSFTFSSIWIDETAWQEGCEDAYTANLPAVQNKGRVILSSSTRAGTFFCRVVDDTLGKHA